ncbi:MAG: AHH domain-containing protein [Flavobacterium sp.]|jgi:hypothetical protein|nr:AHH domain-containing protein [Flavobacterium sp.]
MAINLRKSLGIAEGSGLHAHHKIPVELLKTDNYMQAAVNQGFEFSGNINGKALTGYEHLFTNANFYPHHNAYNNLIKNIIQRNKGSLAEAKLAVETKIIPEINEFLKRAENAGRSINDQAIFEGF